MSGGEQQRVAVARAFATDASLILADEPTANLDQHRAEFLMQILRATSRDLARPVLMVTHDLRTHHMADRVLWLEGGKLRPLQPSDLLPPEAKGDE
jgi:putative ABC transport system ATP-binding protein